MLERFDSHQSTKIISKIRSTEAAFAKRILSEIAQKKGKKTHFESERLIAVDRNQIR